MKRRVDSGTVSILNSLFLLLLLWIALTGCERLPTLQTGKGILTGRIQNYTIRMNEVYWNDYGYFEVELYKDWGTYRSIYTNQDGSFRFTDIVPDNYTLMIRLPDSTFHVMQSVLKVIKDSVNDLGVIRFLPDNHVIFWGRLFKADKTTPATGITLELASRDESWYAKTDRGGRFVFEGGSLIFSFFEIRYNGRPVKWFTSDLSLNFLNRRIYHEDAYLRE